jgi:hypothetical protein
MSYDPNAPAADSEHRLYARRPDPSDTPADYEVHEYIDGEFVWHLYDTEGVPVLAWNSGQFIADSPADGESTLWGWDGRKIGQHTFRSEYEAHVWVRDTFAVPCRTRFTEAHPDPRVEAFLASDATHSD